MIRTAELAAMATAEEGYPDDALPEVAFVGRSNVGKSSLLNALLGRKKLAYTGATPGKTRTINFYRINDAFYFVDLPGYGYAQIDKGTRAAWEKQMQGYIRHRKPLELIIQLVDSRHEPSALDLQMTRMIKEAGRPFLIAATKRDKLSNNQWQQSRSRILKKLDIQNEQLFPVTIQDKTTIATLRDAILE